MDRICVYVTQTTTAHLLKFVWTDAGRPFLPYCVDRDGLTHAVQAVRESVDHYVRSYSDPPTTTTRSRFRSLATAGAQLYQAIFTRVTGDQSVEEIKAWLTDRSKNQLTVEFIVDDRIYVPWGLVYEGGESPNAEHGRHSSCVDFWAIKYQVTANYFRITPGSAHGISRKDIELLVVINKEVYERTRKTIGRQGASRIDAIMRRDGDVISSTTDLFERWQLARQRASILFFYCHGTGTELKLSDDDVLRATDWRPRLKRSHGSHRWWSLVILNACETAVGSKAGGFLEATGSSGFHGFIGAEGILPPEFALRFGTELLDRFLTSGDLLSTIVNNMRLEYLPLSVLYGVYCYPDIHVSVCGHDEEIQVQRVDSCL